MQKKFKIIMPVLILIFSLVSVNAIMPVPKIELEEYEITSADKSKIFVEGTVSIAKGQQVTVRTENNYSSIPITATKLGSSGGKENFQLKIPATYLSEGTNKFYVRSEGLRKVIHPSNMREVVVKISNGSSEKKNQTISASNKSIQVGKTVSLGAKASSGLPLTYSSSNTSIATINGKGVVTGKKAGTCKVTITQNGDNMYKSISKIVTITVIKNKTVKKSQKIIASNKTLGVGKSINLNAKASSGLALTYKSSNAKIATINKNGKIKGIKKGKVKITIKQAGNTTWNKTSKTIVVTIKAGKYSKPSGRMAEGKSPGAGIAFSNYRNEWGWVIRATNPIVANDISKYAKIITKNNKIGYSQANGVGPRCYKSIIKKGPAKAQGKASCCPFALICAKYSYKQNGYNVNIDTNVRSYTVIKHIKKVNKSYTSKGKPAPFKIIKMSNSKFNKSNYKKYCYAGDILIRKTQKHTAVLL